MTEREEAFKKSLVASRALVSRMGEDTILAESAAKLTETVISSLEGGGKVFLFGNGGSAADSAHLAAEFVGSPFAGNRPLPAISLATDLATITAISNDYGYAEVFSRQIEALGKPGDVAIGLSTSGKSPNVIAGLRTARDKGLVAVAMTGEDPGPARESADLLVSIPCSNTDKVQTGHMLVGHYLCQEVESYFSGQ